MSFCSILISGGQSIHSSKFSSIQFKESSEIVKIADLQAHNTLLRHIVSL